MFTDRFNELLIDVCHTTTGDFARLTKYDRSYITHLRNGDRVPAPGLGAARRLSRALYLCALENSAVSELCRCIGAPEQKSEDELCDAIGTWLFDGQPPPAKHAVKKPEPPERRKAGEFGRKLGAAMELADISNLRLAKEVNVDVSVISKYRSGVRVPRANLPLIHDLSEVLVRRINMLGRFSGLSRLIDVPLEKKSGEAAAARQLEKWLRDFSAMDTSLIESFLDDMDNFAPAEPPPISPDDAALDTADDTQDAYWGTDGLRRAVLRFLHSAVSAHKPQLLLYSDQNMEWMVGDRDFSARWAALMSAYVGAGGKIQIIHNVDRGLEEMLAAIRSWLPLYLSGGIESWYCLKPGGDRFFHTQFLEPESACVSASFVTGCEQDARYDYLTRNSELEYCRRFYQSLLKDCRPLFWLDRAGMKPELSAIQRDGELHLIGNTLSLATMPETLLEQIMERSALPEALRRELRADWRSGSELFAEKMDGGEIHECAPLPGEEELYRGRVPVDAGVAGLSYTPEEYAAHVRSILKLSGEKSGYRFYPLTEAPFRRIKIAASSHAAMFGYVAGRSAAFVTANPLMCRAFINFAARLEAQYDVDRLTLRDSLKRFL